MRRQAVRLVALTAAACGLGVTQAQDAASLGRAGQSHLALGDYNAALDELTRALELGSEDLHPEELAALLNDLGGVHMALGGPLAAPAAFADPQRLRPRSP